MMVRREYNRVMKNCCKCRGLQVVENRATEAYQKYLEDGTDYMPVFREEMEKFRDFLKNGNKCECECHKELSKMMRVEPRAGGLRPDPEMMAKDNSDRISMLNKRIDSLEERISKLERQ